ncbi:MAG: site-specific integrase [Methanobrevibacter sp.]|nr:site-specific integrase [Methanobrevibacter sp.]
MATFIPIVGKKGTKIKAIIRVKGYKTTCKTFTGITLAKHWAKKVEAAMEEGTYIEESATKIKVDKVKIEYVDELINYFKNNIASTRYDDYQKYYCMYDWWIDKIGNIKVVNLSASDLSACKQLLLTEEIASTGKPRKANTINKYLMALSTILTFARDELELIEYNPMSKVKIVPKPEGRKRFLSIEELAIYLAACKNHSEMVYLFVLIALGTGGRYSEVQTLKVENIDFQNQRVYYIDTKNNTSRGVYIDTDVMEFLKLYLEKNNIKTGYIFKGKRKDALPFIRGKVYEIIKEVGLENFTVHDMRHTFASHAAMNGASLLDIAEMLGQTAITVTRNYTHLTEKHIDNVVRGFVKKIIPEV